MPSTSHSCEEIQRLTHPESRNHIRWKRRARSCKRSIRFIKCYTSYFNLMRPDLSTETRRNILQNSTRKLTITSVLLRKQWSTYLYHSRTCNGEMSGYSAGRTSDDAIGLRPRATSHPRVLTARGLAIVALGCAAVHVGQLNINSCRWWWDGDWLKLIRGNIGSAYK